MQLHGIAGSYNIVVANLTKKFIVAMELLQRQQMQ